MRVVWRFLRRYWWTFLVGVGAVAGFCLYILFPRRQRDTIPDINRPPSRTFKERAQTEVERVHLEGEVEKVRATSAADTRREEIDRIEEIGKTDPAEGRQQISLWIARNL